MSIVSDIFSQVVLISNNYQLSAEISSLFFDIDKYFVVLEEPRDWQQLTDNQITMVTNVLAYIKPKFVILWDIDPDIEKMIIDRFPSISPIIIIKDSEEIEEKIIKKLNLKINGEFHCNPQELALWLVEAKKQKKRLIPDKTKPIRYSKKHIEWTSWKIVCFEENHDIMDIISANYAFAERDSLLATPSFTDQQVDDFGEEISYIGNNEDIHDKTTSFDKLKSKIKDNRLFNFPFNQYHHVLFVTDGIPYSFVLDNIIPISHLIRNFLWLSFVNSYIDTRELVPLSWNAILFSTRDFDGWDEMDVVEYQLKHKNYNIQYLYWKFATIDNFTNYNYFLPYDILHIWTHGWEIDWYNILEEFKDDKGNLHKIEYNEIRIINNPWAIKKDTDPQTLIAVSVFQGFESYDWKPRKNQKNKDWFPYWMNNISKNIDFSKDRKIIRREYKANIKNSESVLCYDWPNLCAFHSLGNWRRPFVFNNSCSSVHRLASKFSFAWARGYIWTLWNVEENVAKDVSEKFYSNLNNMPIFWALWDAQRHIENPSQKNIYTYRWTDLDCVFSVESFHKSLYFYELLNAKKRWELYIMEKKHDPSYNDAIQNAKKGIDFLRKHIVLEKLRKMEVCSSMYWNNHFYK